MPYTSAQIQAAINQLVADIGLLHDIVQGDSTTDIITAGGTVPSVAKFYNQLLAGFAIGNFPGAIRSDHTTVSANYTAVSGDTGKTINVTGGQFTITFGPPAGYSTVFTALVINRNVLACTFVAIDGFGLSPVKLWPGESILLQKAGATWAPCYNIAPKRFKRLGGMDLYVGDGTTGSDTANDGLDPARPFRKIQTAVNTVQYEIDGGAIIHVLAGTHTPPTGFDTVITVGGPVMGADQVNIQGAAPGSGLQNTFILQCPANGRCLDCQDNGILVINGFYCTSAGGAVAEFVHCRQQAVLDFNGCDVGPTAGGIHMSCTTNASINIGSNGTTIGVSGKPIAMFVRGSAATHVGSSDHGYVNYGTYEINIPSALAMGYWFSAANLGEINNGASPVAYAGAGVAGTTGNRFSAANNSVIVSGVTEPGNVAGTTGNGGLHF